MSKLIRLTQGKFAIVDDHNYEWLSKYKWYYGCGGYAARDILDGTTKKKKTILMHRLILNAPPGKECDHIDGDRLNNLESNLRLCTHAENQHNQRPHQDGTSRWKGVCWHKRDGKWRARIHFENNRKHLGCFKSEDEAALAYDTAAIELFGEFARLNFSQPAPDKQKQEVK